MERVPSKVLLWHAGEQLASMLSSLLTWHAHRSLPVLISNFYDVAHVKVRPQTFERGDNRLCGARRIDLTSGD